MPAAAVISSGVHERSIAVVKTFLVDMIRKAVMASCCFCPWVLPVDREGRVIPFLQPPPPHKGGGCTLSKLERFRQALFLEAMNTLAWNARIGLSFGRAGEEPSHV
jgi:hypothetical protein